MDKITNLENYEKIERIRKGPFGDVFKFREKTTGNIYAAKIGYKSIDEETKNEKIHLARDVNLLSQLNHPSILKFIGFNPYGFKNKPTIITEYLSTGSLFDVLELERNGLSPNTWDATKKLIDIYGIASAMSYLHSNNIIHRDLKPQNILENEYLFPKISDFSFSKVYHQNLQSITFQSTFSFRSTPIYIAPEIWKNNQYSKKGDVYAFAFILYEIMTTERPFNDYTSFKISIDSIQNKKRPKFQYKIPEVYRSLIERCWSDEPENRPHFDQIVKELKENRDYITEGVNLNDFLDYVNYIDQFQPNFDKNKKILSIEEILNKRETKLLTKTVLEGNNLITSKQKSSSSSSHNENKNPQNFFEELTSSPFFSRMDRHVQKFFIYVIDEDAKEKNITFNNNNLSTLSDWIPSDDFISVLKLFDQIKIEMKYPCSNFQKIFSIVAKIKKSDLQRIQVHLLVSSRETNFILGDNAILNTVEISPFVKSICDSSFNGCKLLKEIEIPPSVTKIGEMAFSGCIQLEEINIKSTVEFVGKGAFKGCSSLKQITINPMKTNVDFTAFQDCENFHSMVITSDDSTIVPFNDEPFHGITKIIINSSVTTINAYSFKRFLYIKEIFIPESVSCIDHSAFAGCLSLEKINLPDLEKLETCMFYGCSSLKELNFPSILIVVECFSFFGCSSLKEIVLPESVSATGRYTFAHCISVAHVKLPDSLMFIGEASFIDCISLEEIEFPPKLKYIDHRAFEGCKKLKRIHLPNSIQYLGEYVFDSCISLEEATYSDPFDIKIVPVGFFNNCSSLIKFDLSSFDTICESAFRGCLSLSNVKLPDNLKVIEENAFRDCKSLIEIEIPRHLISINESAFMNCFLLEKINFSTNLMSSIDDHVFDGCVSLKEIIIPSSVSTIGMYSFCGCTSLKKVVIPKSVYLIGSCSFKNCQALVDLEIPFELKTIGEDCFKGCFSLKNTP